MLIDVAWADSENLLNIDKKLYRLIPKSLS